MATLAVHHAQFDLSSSPESLHDGSGFPAGLQLVHGSNLDQNDPVSPSIMMSSDGLKLSPHAASNGDHTLHDDADAHNCDALNEGNANYQGTPAATGSQAKVAELPSIFSSLTVELFGSSVSDSGVDGQESVLVAENGPQDSVQPDAKAKAPSGAPNEGREDDIPAFLASRDHDAPAQATKSFCTADNSPPLPSQFPAAQQNPAASGQWNMKAPTVNTPCTHVDLAHALPPGCIVHQAHDSITTTRSIFQTITGEYQEHAVVSSCCFSPHSQIANQSDGGGSALPLHHLDTLQQKRSTITDQQVERPPQQQALSESGPQGQAAESHMIGMSSTSGGVTMGIAAAGGAQMEHLLARVKQEKIASRARAWEENAKSKALNRYTRDETKIAAWENSMKAKAEARMRKVEEKLEKQRAIYVEKMKNAVAVAHRAAQEMRAATEARKAEEIVRANDTASRIRATGQVPRKFLCLHA